jgi:trigger factor
VVQAATVTDTDGNTVDTEEFFGKRSGSEAGDDEETTGVDDAGEDVEAADAGDEAASSEEPSGDTK